MSQRCPECKQFIAEDGEHVCPKRDPDEPSEPPSRHDIASETVERVPDDGGIRLSSHKSTRIKNFDDLIEHCGIDRDLFEVQPGRIKTWEGYAKDANDEIVVETLYAVSVRLEPKHDGIDVERVLRRFETRAAHHSPSYDRRFFEPAPTASHMLELCIFDPHVGMLAWGDETGEDYDSRIADRLFRWAAEFLVDRAASFELEQIVLPVGNDLFHASDDTSQTPRSGNILDVDSRHQKTFERVHDMIVDTTDFLMDHAPVHIPIVPGNHDFQVMRYLGQDLKSWYRNTDRVSVDNSPAWRKYHRYGKNLLGYAHGADEPKSKLPLLLAKEAKEDWSATENHVWHVGHKHHRKSTSYVTTDEESGVRIQMVPSLAAADAYHHRKGWNHSVRAAEAFLWHRELGEVGHFSAPVPDEMP